MKFRIFIFFVWVSSFSIVSSFHQNQEYGNRYQQHPNLPSYSNYAHNSQVYPAHPQFLNTASDHALNSEPQYGAPHRPETFPKSSESSAQSQVKSSHEYKPLVYIPQPQQELPRPYPVDKPFELHVPPEEHVYRPDYTHHVAKPWVSQNNYQPTVNHELYQQPIVYPEPQLSGYQNQPPHGQPQHTPPHQQAQPQHPRPSQLAQPHRSLSPQYQPSPQHLTPPHQQTYYKQPTYAVPVAHAQAEAYTTSETYDAEIPASKPDVKDYLESALLKHYQLDDLGNSHHAKSSDVKLKKNVDKERDTEKPHNNNQNNEHIQKQLLDNEVNEHKKHVPQKNNHLRNPQTVPEQTKHEPIPPKNDGNETFYPPRFAYLNHKQNPTEVNTFPIEVKPVNPQHYRNPIVLTHPNANHSNNILVNEPQQVLPTPLVKTDDSYPIETQNSKIYDSSSLKDKEVTLNDDKNDLEHDLHPIEQRTKVQPEQKPYADKIHPENDNSPKILYSEFQSHSTPADQTIIENPVDKPVDTPSHQINKPKDSIDDVSPLLLYSDTINDTKTPMIASPNSNSDQPSKEFHSNIQSPSEDAKPTKETNNDNVKTNTIVSQKEDLEKNIVTKIDVTESNNTDDKKQTNNKNVSDNGDKQNKPESERNTMLPKDIAKQSSIEGSQLNAGSPADDGTSAEDNDDCTSDEIDPNNNGDDEVAADSVNNSNAVLLSSIDLWEKLLAKQPNLEFQAFNVVTLSPIVEKTSRLFVFPNQTTVEESVETIWKCKGDALPLERKLTTIIKYPSQDENKCD